MQIWPRNTETERSSVNHVVDMINILIFTIETTPSHVMIGHGLVDMDQDDRDHGVMPVTMKIMTML